MLMQKHKFTYCFMLVILSVLLYDTDAYAQQRFSAGPRLGVNLSKYVGPNVIDNKTIAGLSAGAFLMYSSLNHFGISADLLYSQKGARYTDLREGDVTQRVNYLEIPIALRYFLTRSGDFRPNLYVGPALGFKLNASQTIENTGRKDDITDGVTPVDLGLMAGFQFNFKGLRPRQRFLIDTRYTYGLSDLQVASGNGRNSVFTLSLGYSFGVGPEYRSR